MRYQCDAKQLGKVADNVAYKLDFSHLDLKYS